MTKQERINERGHINSVGVCEGSYEKIDELKKT